VNMILRNNCGLLLVDEVDCWSSIVRGAVCNKYDVILETYFS